MDAPVWRPGDASVRRATAGAGLDPGVSGSPKPALSSYTAMKRSVYRDRWLLAVLFLCCTAVPGMAQSAAAQTRTLKIGVTLHPYYSWTKNVVGDLPGYEVRAILPGEIDAGDYQPRPEDIKKLVDLDAIVINGIGHDDFIMPMIKASANTHLAIIRVNEQTPQIHSAHGTGVNSHTFISF